MKRRPKTINPIERAIVVAKWRATVTSAQISALIGGDSNQLVNKAGRVMFVVLGACIAEQVDPESLGMRLLIGAVNAVHDQAGEPDVPPLRRKSIISGLETCTDLIAQLTPKAIADAVCDLELKLRAGDMHLSDFQALCAT